MGKFNNNEKAEMPELNTSSLPDLIFSILFFFMIVTSMREEEVKVEFKAPKGTELNKLEKKTAGVNVYIGESKAGESNGKPVIQINNTTIDNTNLNLVSESLRKGINAMDEEDRKYLRIVLKIDSGDEITGRKGANMEVVNDVKEVLRDLDALRIMYSADEKNANK